MTKNSWILLGKKVFTIADKRPVKENMVISREVKLGEKIICERKTETGSIYTEIMSQKEIAMNPLLKMNEPMELKRLVTK